jgi:hypothetical protein
MRLQGEESWQLRIDQWNEWFAEALWIRAAEGIDVPAGGMVPGPLIIDPAPQPSPQLADFDLTGEWQRWWQALCGLPEWSPRDGWPPPQTAFGPPGFAGFVEAPLLRETVSRRWQEAIEWHAPWKMAGVRDFSNRRRWRPAPMVADVERALGRKAKPFVLSFQVLPVDDNEIRQTQANEFLVSEAVYEGPDWPNLLRGLVEQVA